MRWYIPSWNGDLRLEASEQHPEKQTVLSIVSPTEAEKKILDAIQDVAVKNGWIDADAKPKAGLFSRKKKVTLFAPVADVGPIVAKLMRPGEAVLTAITFKDGKMVTSSGTAAELKKALDEGPDHDPTNPGTSTAIEKSKAEPDKAVTVKRPTPCCPACTPGAIGPASEVLLSFLTDEQHESWAKSRTITVEGGLSGHRYLLAHRHSETGQKIGRICYDLDNDLVVHFHDWTVPPEEEVLAAKLILEHCEPWLRNEATLYQAPNVLRFKNPFGDGGDGTRDAAFTDNFGAELEHALKKARLA